MHVVELIKSQLEWVGFYSTPAKSCSLWWGHNCYFLHQIYNYSKQKVMLMFIFYLIMVLQHALLLSSKTFRGVTRVREQLILILQFPFPHHLFFISLYIGMWYDSVTCIGLPDLELELVFYLHCCCLILSVTASSFVFGASVEGGIGKIY